MDDINVCNQAAQRSGTKFVSAPLESARNCDNLDILFITNDESKNKVAVAIVIDGNIEKVLKDIKGSKEVTM